MACETRSRSGPAGLALSAARSANRRSRQSGITRAIRTRTPLTVGHVLGEPFVTADEPLATFAAAHPIPTPAWAGVASRMAGGSAGWMPPSTLTMPAFSGGSRTPSPSGLSSSGRVSKPAGGIVSSPFDLTGLIGDATGGRVLRRDEGFVAAGSCETCPDTEECYTILDGVCREVPCDSDLCACGPCEGGVGGGGCSPLEPPSGRTMKCFDSGKIKGSTTECQLCDIQRSPEDFEAMSTDGIDELVRIDDQFSADSRDLLEHAWALLRDNTDLIKWAVCWVTGKASKGDCLVRRVEGQGANTYIEWAGQGRDNGFHTNWGEVNLPSTGGTIQVYDHWQWTRYVDIWQDDEEPVSGPVSEGPVGRMCASVDLACTLLHELTHVCWRSYAISTESGECRDSYLIENIFRWAMYKRYPSAVCSACCRDGGGGDDKVFGLDESVWPARDCLPEEDDEADGEVEEWVTLAAAKERWLGQKADKPGESIETPEWK